MNVLNLNNQRKAGFENIKDYTADLYILNTFKGSDTIYQILKNTTYFSQIYLIDKKINKGIFRHFNSLFDALSYHHYFADKYPFLSHFIHNRYDVICVPKYSVFIDQVFRANNKAQIELFEEGSASYNPIDLLQMQPYLYRQVARIFHNTVDLREYRRLYLLNSRMYFSDKADLVVEIPKFNDVYLQELRILFSDLNKQDIDKPIYWISQFLNNEDFNLMLDQVLNKLNNYHDEVLFCQHPRNYLENKYHFSENSGSHIWELKILDKEDFDDKLLISVHSTACFSPKMLYDKEPYIIFIYKLGSYEVSNMTPALEKTIAAFKASYSDPDKVMIPENIEEFEKCLKKYLKRG